MMKTTALFVAVSLAMSVAGAATGASAAAAASAANTNNNSDPQSSLTLDPKVLATGFENDGQDVPEAGQVASLTSSNNFINFCATVPNLPITNGKQIATGSCNPAPMGVIPSSDVMPSCKFTNPKNGDTIPANTDFTISMAVARFETGNFVNADSNYFAAPQQLNAQGEIIGHSHIVVEALQSLDQTTPTNPNKQFAYFKGLNAAAVNGVLSTDLAKGLPAGFYRLASINTAANHQPALVPIAQHGSLDDFVYFTVSDSGAAASPAASNASSVAAPPAASSAAASPAASSAAPAKNAPTPPAKGKAPARVAQPGGRRPQPQPIKRPAAPASGKSNTRGRRAARAVAQL